MSPHEARTARTDRRTGPILIVFALLMATQISPWWYPTQDGLNYLSLARNFADGRLERLGSPQLRYAPGYPAVISPAFRTGPRPFLAVSAIHWLLAVVIMTGVYRWSRGVVPEQAALLVTGLVVLGNAFWDHLRVAQSEIAFMAGWIVTAVAMERLARHRERQAWPATLGHTAVVALLLILTCVVRHVGIFLAAGFGVRMIVEAARGVVAWRRAIVLTLAVGLPASATLVALIAHDHAAAGRSQGKTYLEYFDDQEMTLAAQVSEGVRLRIGDIGRLTVPGMLKAYGHGWVSVNTPIYLAVAACVGVGWWRFVQRTRNVFALAAPFYMAIYVVWPFSQAARYVFPLLPLLVVSLWYGLERFERGRLRLMSILLAAHVIVAGAYWAKGIPAAVRDARHWGALEELATRVPEPWSTGAVVGTRNPEWLMFQFALDRAIPRYRNLDEVPPTVDWVMTESTYATPAHFRTRGAAGCFVLLERTHFKAPPPSRCPTTRVTSPDSSPASGCCPSRS